jgi:ubiquinone biosynthesis accessory factor UbiJ
VSDASLRRGLGAVLADALAELANRSLALDPASRARLSALEGRQIQLTTELPPPLGRQDQTLTVEGGRLRLLSRPADRPNVIVRGSPVDLAGWLLRNENAPESRLEIEGDSTVLAELRAVLVAFRPDLGAPLRRVFGDEFAQTALGTAELALASLRSALEGAGQTVRDGAARAFVDRVQTDAFLDELDDLSLRVDRLSARVQAQEQRHVP